LPVLCREKALRIKPRPARRFDAVQSDGGAESRKSGEGGMNFKWFGPLALLAALAIDDQIRINRPGHKYRLVIKVETPAGVR
jgi:hypothetical protein